MKHFVLQIGWRVFACRAREWWGLVAFGLVALCGRRVLVCGPTIPTPKFFFLSSFTRSSQRPMHCVPLCMSHCASKIHAILQERQINLSAGIYCPRITPERVVRMVDTCLISCPLYSHHGCLAISTFAGLIHSNRTGRYGYHPCSDLTSYLVAGYRSCNTLPPLVCPAHKTL